MHYVDLSQISINPQEYFLLTCSKMMHVFCKQAFNNSLAPDMVDELLRVLRLEQIGKNDHAKQIEEVYRKKIGDHRRCEMCRTGRNGPHFKLWS